jgi:pyrimidine-nucleoside phosphorylase
MKSLVELIAHKRDGGDLGAADIERLIAAFLAGELADYQMSALCMAIYFRGMSASETAALTMAMLHSGSVVDLGHVDRPKVDKHSTGGVGDKVSICLAPLVAACGVAVPMISGRGLGHTGGTLDKLEAIPGFKVDLPIDDFRRIVNDVGTAMIGQTADLAPADRRIYALRDVTATVESIPLIVASILSKKLAEGIDALVLDVKAGRGAFMKNVDQARALATALCDVGRAAGKRVSALITDMEAPLGRTVGNALETREAIAMLRGEAPEDLCECTLALGCEMLALAGMADGARERLEQAIDSGSAARVFERMIEAQGGDPRVVDDPDRLPAASCQVELTSDRDGTIAAIDALEVGLAAVAMGAGRTRADQPIDPRVGIELCAVVGEAIEEGQPLAILHLGRKEDAEEPAIRVRRAITIDPGLAPSETLRKVVLERLEA